MIFKTVYLSQNSHIPHNECFYRCYNTHVFDPALTRIRKALENRTNMEDDRVAILEAQLSQAKLIAEESDKKYEEVNACPTSNSLYKPPIKVPSNFLIPLRYFSDVTRQILHA